MRILACIDFRLSQFLLNFRFLESVTRRARGRHVEDLLEKVIIAEDDLLIADLLEEVLVTAGYDVCGLASTVTEAVDLCNRLNPDLAVIDVRLAAGGVGTDVAAKIVSREKLGILYATGNAGHVVLTASDGEACITKPYLPDDIVRALRIVSEIVGTGTVSAPFPRNFQLLRQAELRCLPRGAGHDPA